MGDIKLIVKMSEEVYNHVLKAKSTPDLLGIDIVNVINAVKNSTSLTPNILADALMEERIRGKLDSDTIFEKDVIDNVRCRLTVDIIDHRPCYCGAELREVWRKSEDIVPNKEEEDDCTDIYCEKCRNNYNCIEYLEEQERMNEEDDE